MKIVGTTDTGFLAQITLDELGLIMGFGRHPLYNATKDKFKEAIGLDDRHNIKTGTVIKIVEGFDYLTVLKDKQSTAKKCASTLRELADMITTALPEIVIVEKDKEPF
jgi:hypothetical protein